MEWILWLVLGAGAAFAVRRYWGFWKNKPEAHDNDRTYDDTHLKSRLRQAEDQIKTLRSRFDEIDGSDPPVRVVDDLRAQMAELTEATEDALATQNEKIKEFGNEVADELEVLRERILSAPTIENTLTMEDAIYLANLPPAKSRTVLDEGPIWFVSYHIPDSAGPWSDALAGAVSDLESYYGIEEINHVPGHTGRHEGPAVITDERYRTVSIIVWLDDDDDPESKTPNTLDSVDGRRILVRKRFQGREWSSGNSHKAGEPIKDRIELRE